VTRIASAAIVGAGMAGLACAAALRAGGVAVTLFDKGRRAGGRIATRRADGISFDHGAQYATARDPAFRALIADLEAAGAAAAWEAAGGSGETRWVGTPGMSALPRRLAELLAEQGAASLMGRNVAYLHAGEAGWRIRHLPADSVRPGTVTAEGGEVAPGFDAVLLALPAPQAIPLLAAMGHPHAGALESVVFAPCWAVMAAFDTRLDRADTMRPESGPLGWVAREGSRPGHAATPDAWVLHATGGWSRANLERDAAEVATELLAAFAPDAPAPAHLSAHRWRYALVETALGQPCLWDPAAAIGVCGDFCLGPRVEAAWQSGTALASAVLSHN
jgi:predicted NAD/FAD-dependent oxidoreductase